MPSVVRNRQPKIVMNGWRGLNEAMSPGHLRPGDLASVKNMEIVDGVALTTRLGQESRHDRAFFPNTSGVKRLLYYKSTTGVKKVLAMFGDKLCADNNDGKFVYVATITGTVWMVQYQDVVLIGSDEVDVKVYDPISGLVSSPEMDGVAHASLFTSGLHYNALDGASGYLEDGYYIYAFTFEIKGRGVILAETGGINGPSSLFGTLYNRYTVHLTGGDDNYVQILRQSNTIVNFVPDYVSVINVYRSAVFSSDPADSGQSRTKQRFDLFYVGNINVSDMKSASEGSVIFTDYGDTPIGQQIRKGLHGVPFRSSLATMHKGRLWTGATTRPDQVGFSLFGEPLAFLPESTLAVGDGEPETITALKSLRNETLAVLKPDKSYAILGGDDELIEGVPNVSVVLVDASTGCLAHDSCVDVETGAIMFYSERGVMIWESTHPMPVDYEAIKSTLKRIPSNRKSACVGEYSSSARRYRLFFTNPYTGVAGAGSYNRDYVQFSFVSRGWTAGRLERGVGAACSVNNDDDDSFVLWGINDIPLSTFASSPWVVRADSGHLEAIDPTLSGDEKIDFEVDFGYQDDGAPWLRKDFQEIAVEMESQVPLSVEVWVDSNGPFYPRITTLEQPVGNNDLVWGDGLWGEQDWASSSFGTTRRILTDDGDNLPKGHAIRLKLSGRNDTDPVKIISATVFYVPEES